MAAATLLLLGTPAAAGPPCIARLELEPSQAFVGQQVLYRLRLLSRDDVQKLEWLEPPAFPGLRAERLPGRPEADRLTLEGVEYGVREEQRAIFPERAGEIGVGAASLRCRTAHQLFDLRVPEATLRVRELPAAGQPRGFAGLVGPLALSRSLEPPGLALGGSLSLTLRLQGGGNLWDAPDPLPEDAAFAGAEIFRRRPELELERGTRLFVRRRFRYQLVPRREGTFVVPEIRVPYFDPASGRYREARAPALEVAVGPRAEPPGRAALPPEAPAPGPEPHLPATSGPGAGLWLWTAAGALLLGASAALLLRRRREPGLEAFAIDPADDAEAAAAAWARALRAGLAARLPGAQQLAPEEILAQASLAPALRAAAELLAAVERARFDPEAPAPDRAAVERALEALRHQPRA